MNLRTTLNTLLVVSGLAVLTHPIVDGVGGASPETLYVTSQVSMGALVVTALLFLVRRFACDG
jgi:hypothetical protein